MNRKEFIKLSALTGITLGMLPQLAFQSRTISYEELIGKGNPTLFGNGFKLQKEAHDAFIKMKEEALKSEISIKIVSSYRNFDHQNRIWERKFKSFTSTGLSPQDSIKKIIEYSTIPGTSRHHWATDIDIIDAKPKQPKNVLQAQHFDTNGCYGKLKTWMDTNASDFGFYLVYTNAIDRKGFKYEPWHYSFKPLSSLFLSEYKQLNISEILQKEQLLGNEHFSEEFLSKYYNENILDINPELL